MKKYMLAVVFGVLVAGCSNGPTGPSATSNTVGNAEVSISKPIILDGTFVLTGVSPAGNREVHTPFIGRVKGLAVIKQEMLPAQVGIVYVEGDGSSGWTQWATLGELHPNSYGDKPHEYNQIFRAEDFDYVGDYCTSYILCKDFLPGKEINAVFFIGKKGKDLDAIMPWDSKMGTNAMHWDEVAYRQFIPLGYRFTR